MIGYVLCSFLIFLSFVWDSHSDDFSAYLENFRNLEARFMQEDPDGKTSLGVLSFVSPKKFRLEYFSPSPIVLIFNGNVVTYYDRDLEETSHKILDSSNYVVKFASQFYKILGEKSRHVGGKIRFTDRVEDNMVTVVFNAKPVFLESLLVSHSDNSKTKIKFFEIMHNKKFAKNLLTEF